MIQFINVTKEYKNGTIGLSDIDVKIESGEFAFLVGASGAGKSTFTKLMIREILPTSGSILINGKSIIRLKKKEVPLLRRSMGFVFQNYRLLDDRTAEENVAFTLEVLGLSSANTAAEIMDILNDINIKGTTIVMATHDKAIVNRTSHRVLELSHGKLVRDDKKGGYDLDLR